MTKYRTGYLLWPDGGTAYRFQRYWEVQPPPYKKPLGYQYSTCNSYGGTSYHDGSFSYVNADSIGLGNASRDKTEDAINLCYAKLVNQIGDSSQWANNLLEAGGAISGASARILQLARFASHLRKGNIVKAAKVLGTPVPKSLKGAKAKFKSFGDQFLEFHFGWVPLAQDIHSAMQTLSKPDFGLREIQARSYVFDQYFERYDEWAWPWHYIGQNNLQVTYRCKMGASIRISNPNVYLANQLGLINPASVAWEAVPYSFVVDWFSNVGQVIASMSDFAGLDLVSSYTTVSLDLQLSGSAVTLHGPDPWDSASGGGRLFKVGRSAGIARPTLRLKPFKGFSLTRGTTAISLLLQKL